MASLGNGNSWRRSGEGWDPVERGDVSTEGGVSAPDDASEPGILDQPLAVGYEFNYPKTAWRHALCKGCYCIHDPPCPPCGCAFHNPNVL